MSEAEKVLVTPLTRTKVAVLAAVRDGADTVEAVVEAVGGNEIYTRRVVSALVSAGYLRRVEREALLELAEGVEVRA